MLKLDAVKVKNGGFSLRADLTIAPAAITAVIGPSGAGKSTLLETIAGFRTVAHGLITWDGRDLTELAPGQRPVAMLFQDGNLFPHLTAGQNVGLGIRPEKRLKASEQEQVRTALDRVGLATLGERKPAELSGGQQSRVALARVLVQRRDLLLLDEPFSALGPALKTEMLDLTAQLVVENNTTVLMVSHDPNDARRIASQSVLVAEGVANPPEPTTDLLNNPPPALQKYLR